MSELPQRANKIIQHASRSRKVWNKSLPCLHFSFVMKRLRKTVAKYNNNHPETLHRENDPCNGALVALPLLDEIVCDIIARFFFTYLENRPYFYYSAAFLTSRIFSSPTIRREAERHVRRDIGLPALRRSEEQGISFVLA